MNVGDTVLINTTGEYTRRTFGFDPPMVEMLGKVSTIVSFSLGGVKLSLGPQWLWDTRDLSPLKLSKDIKNEIKPVLFQPDMIQEEI